MIFKARAVARSETIRVRACIRLLTEQEGGRSRPVLGGYSYRPNHDFSLRTGEMCMGFIELPAGQDLAPGESIEIVLELMAWPGLLPLIHPGRVWRIQEGPKVVGSGEILEVLA